MTRGTSNKSQLAEMTAHWRGDDPHGLGLKKQNTLKMSMLDDQFRHGINSCKPPIQRELLADPLNINMKDMSFTRHISFTLQLSDKMDYSGGDLLIEDRNGHTHSLPKDRGCIVLFESDILH